MTYRFEALDPASFAALASLTDLELATVGARRMICDEANSAPCRVSLEDAVPGERLLLVNVRHLDAPRSPYRADGPVFVRENAVRAMELVDAVPEMISRRLLSMRVYDHDAMMLEADVVEGREIDQRLRAAFADQSTAFVDLHTARRGCFLARVRRDGATAPE